MGVHGLWNLLEPSGKAVPLETLENKVLAVDVSIWLHQLVKGFQDSRGNPIPNAHLLGLFHRICKLLFFKIKPVFVFDGDVPLLKKQTVAARQRQRGKLQEDATEMRQKLAKNILKHAAIKEALGSEKADQQVNLNMSRARQEPDLFELPPQKPSELSDDSEIGYMSSSGDDEEEDGEATASRAHIHADLHSIDVNSEDFKALPADIRHDILTELKETRKQNSWGRLHEMPEDSGEFSSFQMNRLLKRRNFQVSLEEAEKEMGGRTLTLGEMEEVLNDQGVITDPSLELGKRIASDSTSRILYVREAAKRTLFSPGSTKPPPKDLNAIPQSSNKSTFQAATSTVSSDQTLVEENMITEEKDEFEDDWISDSECDASVDVNSDGAHQVKSSRVDLARDFMFVASDLTPAQIEKILAKRNSSPQKKSKPQADLVSTVKEPFSPSTSGMFSEVLQPEGDLDYIGIISEESESDSEVTEEKEAASSKPIEIVVQPDKKYNIEEDMFADIFINIEHAMFQHQKHFVEGLKVESNQRDVMADQQKVLFKSSEENKLEKKLDGSKIVLKDRDENQTDSDKLNFDELSHNTNYDKITTENNILPAKAADSPMLIAVDMVQPINDNSPLPLSNAVSEMKNDFEDSGKEHSILKDSLKSREQQRPPTTVISSELIESEENVLVKVTPVNDIPSEMMDDALNNSDFNLGRENESDADSDMECDIVDASVDFSIPENSVDEQRGKQKENESITIPGVVHPVPSTSKISTVELQDLQATLENQHHVLLSEQGKADRMAASITSQMSTEAQELLRLFGLPYIVAPMEAEAQCAFLDNISLTDGTISDDSDIWLFGGQKVYKNFFNQKKHVMQFSSADIQHLLKLARNQMILLALLTGSDYTAGLSGVGPVTALEILAAFPSGKVDDQRYMARDLSFGLKKFGEWFRKGRPAGPGTAVLRNKLKDLELSEGFPSLAVIEGYLKPTIDESKERFTWGKPDLIRLQEYTRVKFGWTKMKTDEILLPVINKLNERQKQMSLDAYFHVKLPSPDGKLSKRVQKAVFRLTNEATNSDAEDDPQPVTKRKKKQSAKDSTSTDPPDINKISTAGKAKTAKKRKAAEEMPGSSGEYIPQREKDKLHALQSKIKAIELFRTSRLEVKKSAKRKQPPRIEKKEAELSESDSDSE